MCNQLLLDLLELMLTSPLGCLRLMLWDCVQNWVCARPRFPEHCDHSCLVRMHLPDSLELRADMGVWLPTVPEI